MQSCLLTHRLTPIWYECDLDTSLDRLQHSLLHIDVREFERCHLYARNRAIDQGDDLSFYPSRRREKGVNAKSCRLLYWFLRFHGGALRLFRGRLRAGWDQEILYLFW